MNIEDLTNDERLALIALLKLVVRADNALTDAEAGELSRVAKEMGKDIWRATLDEACRRFTTTEDVSRFAETIERPQARKLIYNRLVRAARADGIVPQEAVILLHLAQRWKVGKPSSWQDPE